MHLHPHLLGAAETILNAELQQQLQSTEMRIVLHGKGKKDNDRLRRYKELLKDCKSASECLLRSNAYFELEQTQSAGNELSGDATSFDASERLITIREGQMEELVAELEHNLLHAAWLEQQCQRATEPEHRGSHYLHWKSEIERAGLRDPTATDELRKYLSAAPENVGPDTEEMYYRDPPTAKELKQEKAAADKRVKQAKAKKEAEKKAKKASKSKQTQKSSRSSKAVAAPDEDYEEMDVSESESIQADGDDMDLDTPESIQTDDVDPDPPNLKPNKILKDDFKEYASVLRSLTGHLRSLATELVSRTRSLRFAFGSQELCQWCFDSDKAPICESCGMVARNLDEFSINVRCGHSTCSECIEKTNDVVCAFNGCGEGAESFRLRKPSDLVGDGKSWFHGAKVGHIITLINSLPKGEQVLLFVQFEDVMDNIASALEAADISNYVLRKKANPKEMVNMMIDFQDNQGQDKKRVLLLNPSSETAAGM